MQAEFQLGNVEDGLLPSAFLAGLLIASIAYSELTTRYNAFRMTGRLTGAHDTQLLHAIVYSELTTRYNAFRMTGRQAGAHDTHLPHATGIATQAA